MWFYQLGGAGAQITYSNVAIAPSAACLDTLEGCLP